MPSYFRDARNVELSLIDHLVVNLGADWPGTTVVKTFKQAAAKDVNLPIVAVRLADTNSSPIEIGNTTLDDRHLLIIDIFSSNDGERLDMKDYIKSILAPGWTHYSWSRVSGGSTSMAKTTNGRDFVTNWVSDQPLDFGESVDKKDRFRHRISIRVKMTTS